MTDIPKLALRCSCVSATFSHTSPSLLLIFALDLQLADVARLMDDDAFLLHGLVERNEPNSVEGVGAPQQEKAQVFVGEGAGDG